jgi:1,4-dihydroxy-2-naphthoyl-CoA hydrolase
MMLFTYRRVIYFRDADAAGVVYFANVLAICHEAYEASLVQVNIDLKAFFRNSEVAVPIAHAEVDFFRPITCGDRLLLHLTPTRLNETEFAIAYTIFLENQLEKPVSKALTRHVCINPLTRQRQALSAELEHWLQQWELAE